MPTPLIPDMAVFQRKLATLPLVTYRAGETVLSAASKTGRLLILKEGAVAVVKEGVEIARVAECSPKQHFRRKTFGRMACGATRNTAISA
jgi:hypothetical protein